MHVVLEDFFHCNMSLSVFFPMRSCVLTMNSDVLDLVSSYFCKPLQSKLLFRMVAGSCLANVE